MPDIRKNIPLKEHTSFGIGGPAAFFLEARSREDIVDGIVWAQARALPFILLGGANNILFPDEPYPGLVIRNAWSAVAVDEAEGTVSAASGTPLPALVDLYVERGFTGLEWAGGLPGTVGGAVFGNAGAFGGEMKDSVLRVTGCRIEDGTVRTTERTAAACGFGYRDSVFKRTGEIVLEAVLSSPRGDRDEVARTVEGHRRYRRERLPLEYGSAGSFFKNIPADTVPPDVAGHFKAVVKADPFPVIPVAAVIAETGLMGLASGGAQISEKHPNFIVNRGSASFTDVLSLMDQVKDTVFRRFGIVLEPEVRIIR